MNKITNILLVCILLAMVFFGLKSFGGNGIFSAAESNFLVGPANVATTSISASFATTTTNTVLPYNAARQYALIINSSPNILYLYFRTSVATSTLSNYGTSSAIAVAASSTYAIAPPNLYVGGVQGIVSGSTSTIATIEITQ